MVLGVNVEQGRIKDADGVNVKTALSRIVNELDLTMILSPSQSVVLKVMMVIMMMMIILIRICIQTCIYIFIDVYTYIYIQDILPEQRARVDTILKECGIKPIEEVDPLTRLSIACPALPLCGLAVAEAERRMPEFITNFRGLLNKLGMGEEVVMLRMTGCPNGCARPYMAELALVGDGVESYQLWTGGSPVLTRVSSAYADRVKWATMDQSLEPLLVVSLYLYLYLSLCIYIYIYTYL
jgi:sulfite reductase (ferredoxin)